MNLKIGDKVKIKKDIIEYANEDHPDLLYARSGDIVIIRKIRENSLCYPIYVSHEDRLDNSFSVSIDEIEVI